MSEQHHNPHEKIEKNVGLLAVHNEIPPYIEMKTDHMGKVRYS